MKPCTDDESLIELERGISNPFAKATYRLIAPLVERILGIRAVNQLYDDSRGSSHQTFFQTTLQSLGVRYRFSEQEAARIPPDGPVFVISNHPFGGLDGVILGDFLLSIRKDTKLLANYLLLRMSEMDPLVYGIDPFGSKEAARFNGRSIRSPVGDLSRRGSFPFPPQAKTSNRFGLESRIRQIDSAIRCFGGAHLFLRGKQLIF
jgi:putative hemolysin